MRAKMREALVPDAPDVTAPAGLAPGAPPPSPDAAPSPAEPERKAAATASRRAQQLEAELAELALLTGAGRDQVLLRAVSFYRRFVRRALRYGASADEHLRAMAETWASRDLHAELAEIRRKVTLLAEKAPITRPAPAKEASALDIFRAAKGKIPPLRASGSGPAADAAAEVGAAESFALQSHVPPVAPPVVPGATAMAAFAAAGLARIVDGSSPGAHPTSGPVPATALPSPQAKADYADRRTRMPKLVF